MSLDFGEEIKKRVDEIKSRYPQPRSAVMPLIYIAQEEIGHINEEAILWVAEQVDMAPVHVRELVTFYTMYYSKPVGKYHVQVCRTLSCALCGAKDLSKKLHEKLALEPGEVSEDGLWSYEEVECLGSCGTAPMCEINDTYFENLTADKLEEIMARIEKEQPDLRFSTKEDKLGSGLEGGSKSAVSQFLKN